MAEGWVGAVVVDREVDSLLFLFGHFQIKAWQGPDKCLYLRHGSEP